MSSNIQGSFQVLEENPWNSQSTGEYSISSTEIIHREGDVLIGGSSTDPAITIASHGNINTGPDILFDVQGLLAAESNLFYKSETGDHTFLGGGALGVAGSSNLVRFSQNGSVDLFEYGQGTFTGTPTQNIAVDSNGNLIEIPLTEVFESPWDNPDNTPADQSSNDIHYDEGNVGLGIDSPESGLHLSTLYDYRKDFASSTGGDTYYQQVANDGSGNFHQYWNSTGTTTPTSISSGYSLNEEYTGTSEWYQIRGSETVNAGDPITWTDIHWYSMETGEHRFNQYGDGNFVSSNPTYLLGVDTNGTIKEVLNPVKPFLCSCSLSGDVNADGILNTTQQRVDAGWNITATTANFTGSPDWVEISINIYVQQPESGTYARIAPEIEIFRDGVRISPRVAHAYQRHATGHDSSSLNITYIDYNPSTNPSYSVRSFQGSNQNDVLNIDQGSFQLKAIL